jgi:hypothetical protein
MSSVRIRPHELEDLLKLLAGCPQGVTVTVLRHAHHCSEAVIEEALEHGLARGEIDPLKTGEVPVVRLFITPLGHELLAIDAAALN